ncbi:MAG: hypothetical protein N4A65_03605 [Cohaesibacter sp.]|nr:hypothetical protein [Cohaesibacter sp.]
MVKILVPAMMIVAVGLTAFYASSQPADAGNNIRPRPQPQRCLDLAKKIGPSKVWWGRHKGSRDLEPMFEWGPKSEYVNQIGCFKTRKACENWLYWMRTDFPHSNFYNPCRRGL